MNRIAVMMAFMGALVSTGVDRTDGATIHVPSEYPTIQEGIDAASPGDTVLVADGAYSGPGNQGISFEGKDLVVRSENGAESTVIDAFPFPGFTLANGETGASVIEGFTITRGYTQMFGAGIYCGGSSPTIVNCLIAGNEANGMAGGKGGGIACVNSPSTTIVGCTITGNSAVSDSWPRGGGLYCWQSSVTLIRSILWGNCNDEIVLHDSLSTATVVCCCVDLTDIAGNGEFIFEGENVFSDPLLCDPPLYVSPPESDPADPQDYKLWSDSPCLPDVSPCGSLIGALPVGCPASGVLGGGGRTRDHVVLGPLSPNPLIRELSFSVTTAHEGRVRVSLFDVRGALLRTLLDDSIPAGIRTLTWAPGGGDAGELPAGVYYLRVETPGETQSRPLAVLR